MSQIALECTACGKPVYRYQGQIDRNTTGRWFCSTECRNATGSKPRSLPDRICEYCGNTYRPVSRRQTAKYCTKSCYDEWQRRNRQHYICQQCGVDFEVSASVARKSWSGKQQYCSKLCYSLGRTVNSIGRSHNGRAVTRNRQGYAMIYEPSMRPGVKGRVLEHRWVAEQRLGRQLASDEQVHHINGDKLDNRPENLAVLSPGEHTLITLSEGGLRRREAQARIRELEAEIARLKQ